MTHPDTAARQAEIVGQEPRIAALPASRLSPDAFEIVRALRQAAGLVESGAIPEIVATLLHHPVLYSAHAAIGVALLGNGALSMRQRELAILRTAWLCGAPYEWGEHVAIAKRTGLSSNEIERVLEGSGASGWDEEAHAILVATEELHERAMISDQVWAQLATFLDERQSIELVYVVGHYTKVAYLQNALRLRLGQDNPGLSAR